MAIDASNLPPIPDGFQLKDGGETSTPSGLPPIPDGFQLKDGGSPTPQDKPTPFYKAMGAELTPEEKAAHPVVAGLEQTAQDVATLGEKAANGLTLGGLDYGLKKANIQPPNFDNTAPENKSALNMGGDVANLGAANKTLGTIGSKIIAPAARAVAKAVPEGLKQSSYALMQSIVNQLPKEFKYGANAGRAMIKEGFSGDAASIKEQADNRIDEIKSQGDALASASTKPVDNSNAIKIIDDKIAKLQEDSPRASSATIKKLQDAKNDLLKVKEGVDENGNKIITDPGINHSNMTPKETLDLKRRFDDATAWKGTAADDTVYNKTMQQARTQLKDNLNEAAPGMKEWNQRYADLRAAQQAAGRKTTYDQANIGMRNMLAGAIRGTVGITTLGAAIHGNGELAGEILAGWGAKEVLGNPMVKSKLAQAIYGLSEADKMAIFKAAPWVRKAVSDTIENFRQKPSFNPEVMPNGKTPNSPNFRNSPIDVSAEPQGGLTYTTKALSDRSIQTGNTARSGVDRPWENNALPSPNTVGIPMGTDYEKPLPSSNMSPKYGTDDANMLYGQMRAKENIPLHPAEEGRAFKDTIYSKNSQTMIAKNMGIKPEQVDHLADIKGLLDSSENGTNAGQSFGKGGRQSGEDTFWGTKSNVPPSLKEKYSQNELSKMLEDKLNGGKVTPGQSLAIKKLLDYYKQS